MKSKLGGNAKTADLQATMPHFWGLVCSTIALGIVAGICSGLLSRFLELVEKVFLGFTESATSPTPLVVPTWRRLTSVVVGGIVAAVIWYFLRNKTSKVPSTEQTVRGARMPVWQTVVHIMTQIFLVATGASIGREVAPREAGALVGGIWYRRMRWLGLSREDRPLLVAAAAGAGFAGIYISPLTGALFGIEVLLASVNLTTVAVCLGMSSIAAAVGGYMRGFEAYYSVGVDEFSHWTILFALLVGLLSGIVGAVFRKFTSWAQVHQTRGPSILWQLPAASLITGLAAMNLPQIMGNGRALAQTAMDLTSFDAVAHAGSSEHTLVMLVLLLVTFGIWKFVTVVFTIRAGASGGTLTPSIAIGAVIGVILGLPCALIGIGIPLWQAAVLGAAATLAASQQAPLMALCMVFEICHLQAPALMPLALAVAVSTGISRLMLRNRA